MSECERPAEIPGRWMKQCRVIYLRHDLNGYNYVCFYDPQLNSLPSYALYNKTEKRWYGESGEVATANDLVSLVSKATGIRYVIGMCELLVT